MDVAVPLPWANVRLPVALHWAKFGKSKHSFLYKKHPVWSAFLRYKIYSLDFTYRTFCRTGGMHGICFQGFRNFAWALLYRVPALSVLRYTALCHDSVFNSQVNSTVWNIDFNTVTIFNQTNRTPSAASGDTCPIDRPDEPPEKRPSVNSAHSLPKPFDFR